MVNIFRKFGYLASSLTEIPENVAPFVRLHGNRPLYFFSRALFQGRMHFPAKETKHNDNRKISKRVPSPFLLTAPRYLRSQKTLLLPELLLQMTKIQPNVSLKQFFLAKPILHLTEIFCRRHFPLQFSIAEDDERKRPSPHYGHIRFVFSKCFPPIPKAFRKAPVS